jgi:DNA-binding beta-propeller fold protein YncE
VLNAGSVRLNGQPLVQDTANGQLFKADVEVPAAGMDVLLEGAFAGAHRVSTKGKFFNIESAISPVNFGVNPGQYLFYLDDADSSVSKLDPKTALSEQYLYHKWMPSSAPVFDFNAPQVVYTVLDAGEGRTQLFGFLVGRSVPQVYSPGCTKDSILNITYDGLNKRILVVTRDDKQNAGEYKVLSLAADGEKAFVNADSGSYSCGRDIEENIVWRMSSGIIKGKFKQFAFHRRSGTFVVADERVYAGQTITVLQGFSEAGEKRFEAKVGPDISNMTINNSKGIIYVAENHSSVDGKIKEIEVATGKVSDLSPTGEDNYIGAYSEIRIDNVNQQLYIADAVSDAFFVVDLAANTLKNMGRSDTNMPLFISEP